MNNATRTPSTFWRDFLTGLAGPAAAVAAERASAPSLAELVDEARYDVLRISAEHAVRSDLDDRGLDASLTAADQRREQLRRAFDAIKDVVGPDSRFGAARSTELGVLLSHVTHVAPDATAGSRSFQTLISAIGAASNAVAGSALAQRKPGPK